MTIPIVDVVLPCLNEAGALPKVLGALPTGYRAIVVDNGSTDDSAHIAASLGATVVEQRIRGFGAAAHAGLLASSASVVAFCDCDGSLDLTELPRVVEPIARGDADLVLGRRRATPGSWSPPVRLANRVLAAYLRARAGVPVHDLGPMRAAGRDGLFSLALTDRRSGYPLEMLLSAHAAGWRLAEVDVSYLPRIGRSKVTGTVRGFLGAVHDMSHVLRAESR
ncbi:glycosyltransferase family 2 protein [Humibacter ginsenosidimutans]|uniref:Glycosyltransferase family 2 protein n=1 Tax=Humibacter ginsenosidimutans TaxID=2599293 RepID=A0A5B8M6Y9_9MICO|nr:glycosyltransferase family 2 protein [Humibacter ginsenosidimutans]QDZ16136.1 glycosyltransferase family 2 protein [Humibacter ginsenosidimutans]